MPRYLWKLVEEVILAGRNLRRNSGRTIAGVLTVASGVAAYLLAGGFIAWIFQEMRESTIHSQLGHAQIVRPQFFEKGIADPYAFLLPGESRELAAIETIPGVVSVTPRLVISGLIGKGDTTLPFSGEGVDPVRERSISDRLQILEGRGLAGAGDRDALLGEGLAKGLDARIGDRVVLLVTGARGSTNAVELTVVGFFSTVSKEYDDTAVRIPIDVARKLMRVSGATSWVVVLDRTERTGDFVDRAQKVLPLDAFQVVPWTQLADFYNKTVVLFSKQIDVVKLIIGVIIVLTIMNTLTMTVLERTMEIGTSLAIGIRSHIVVRMFVMEGVLIGAIGGGVGVVLGYLVGMIVSAIGIPMPPPPGMAHGYVGQIKITAALASDAFVLAIVTTLMASVLPAWRAGKMNVVDALRYNQ